MAVCELSGKKPMSANLVSHSNIKTKTRNFPNVQKKRLFSSALNRLVPFKVATSTIRDLEHSGGLDAYLLRQADNKLSKRALMVKKKILNRLSNAKKDKASNA